MQLAIEFAPTSALHSNYVFFLGTDFANNLLFHWQLKTDNWLPRLLTE